MAIAFDNLTHHAQSGPETTTTFAHTVTGANTLLLVAVLAYASPSGGTTDIVTGVTYNGVAMTRVDSLVSTQIPAVHYLYILPGAATGTHNVVISTSASSYQTADAWSYTGCAQSGQPDNHATGIQTTDQTSVTLTTTVNTPNSWLAAWQNNYRNGNAITPGANTTSRSAVGSFNVLDTNGAQAAGSQSMTDTYTTDRAGWLLVSIAPLATTQTKFRNLLGVGI